MHGISFLEVPCTILSKGATFVAGLGYGRVSEDRVVNFSGICHVMKKVNVIPNSAPFLYMIDRKMRKSLRILMKK